MKRILILGGTGHTGKLMVREAIENGYEVHAIARQAKKLPLQHPRLIVFKGTPTNQQLLAEALEGCVTVLSALNISRKYLFPWSPLITPKKFMSQTMQMVAKTGSGKSLNRIIFISAWGVHETFHELPFWFKALIKWSNIGAAYRDHERQEEVLRQSGLEWTALRPSGLTNGPARDDVKVSVNGKPRPSLTISRHSVARFAVNEIEKQEFVNKAITISKS